MKTQFIFIALILIYFSCGQSTTEQQSTESSENNEEPTIDSNLINQIAGFYIMLTEEGENTFYQEPCGTSVSMVQISETAEGSGDWSLSVEDEYYGIAEVKDLEGTFYINTEADEPGMDLTFLLEPGSVENTFNFGEMGGSGLVPVVSQENLDAVETRPCTDMEALLADLSGSWYELSTIEGEQVIYYPCEDAPGGFGLEDGTFDNWSGSDPYPIVSMIKSDNRIELEYQSELTGETSKYILHNINPATLQFGDGSADDPTYVNEESKGSYPEVNEEC